MTILPTITGIDGNSSIDTPIVAADGLLDGMVDRQDATHRFRNAWLVSGELLDRVTRLELVPEQGETTHVYQPSEDGILCLDGAAARCFEPGEDGGTWNLDLPLNLTEGAYRLHLVALGGHEITAQVMVLRGEKGETGTSWLDCQEGTCTLDRSLIVSQALEIGGSTQSQDLATSAGAVQLAALSLDSVEVDKRLNGPPCPSGYAQQLGLDDVVLCTRPVADGRVDEVVRAGDFWIDRFEASTWSSADCSGLLGASSDNYPATFPDSGQWTAPVFACSVTGVSPARHLTWFQAQQACVASGKRLCTNAQWQAAAAGTFDPNESPNPNFQCNTTFPVRMTGQAGEEQEIGGACISNWGVEDAIGNLGEWVADWIVAGPPPADALADIYEQHPWPVSFGDDLTRNVVGAAANTAGSPVSGLPAALVRGGDRMQSQLAGIFALDARWSPSHSSALVGLRCCLAR